MNVLFILSDFKELRNLDITKIKNDATCHWYCNKFKLRIDYNKMHLNTEDWIYGKTKMNIRSSIIILLSFIKLV